MVVVVVMVVVVELIHCTQRDMMGVEMICVYSMTWVVVNI